MKYALQLQSLGFRKWYEKRLIHAHGYLVLCILAMILIAATAEGLTVRGPTKELVSDAFWILFGGAVATYSWTRYRMHMEIAAEIASHAVCARCGVDGKLNFPQANRLGVRYQCRKCGHDWYVATKVFDADI